MEESQNSSTESAQSQTDTTVHQQQADGNAGNGRPHRQQSQGILRVDTRASRHAMVVPRLSASQVEPSSPQPSVDRLSVTFAIGERGGEVNSVESTSQQQQQQQQQELPARTDFDFSHHQPRRRATLDASYIKRPSTDMQRLHSAQGSEDAGGAAGEEDEYSASACAIIQRRNSSRRQSRRGKRRPSSPFSPDAAAVETSLRRRSSVFTTSSGDTAISMEEPAGGGGGGAAGGATSMIEDQIFENVKLHKEVLHGVKQQPWPLRKKLKLVRQAKAYVRKHDSKLQERLAQTRNTRDAVARASIILNKKWQYFKREIVNFKTVLVPWERRIKQIESQFGSAVASYFIFLRWLFWMNIVISVALVTFVAIPELLATMQNGTSGDPSNERKTMLPEEQRRAKHFLTLWDFEGYLKYSPFFYGWYSNQHTYKAYKLPLAYFVVNLVVYTYSFVAILRKMAENSRMSKLSEKEDECVFSWKLFTGWDYMIGNDETANNRIGSIVLGLKEALLEESEKHRDERNWKVISIRIFVNLGVMAMLALSAWAVVEVVDRSEDVRAANSSWWRQNEITIVMTFITYSYPFVFELLGIIESYHPRKQLRLQLGRIMILNLLNMYSLIYALFKKINSSDEKLQSLKPKESMRHYLCINKPVPCEPSMFQAVSSLAAMSLILSSNASTNNAPNVFNPSPESLTATDYALPMDNNGINVSQDNFVEGPFDVNGIFSDWSIFQREDDRNDSVDPFAFETNNYTEAPAFSPVSTTTANPVDTLGTTDSVDDASTTTATDSSVDSSSSDDIPGVWNPVTEVDENAIVIDEFPNVDDNDIGAHVVNDDYPHEKFDDYGFFGLDYPNDTSDVPNVESLNTEKTTTTTTTTASTPYTVEVNSCQGVGKIVGCYQRICENRTVKLENVSVSMKNLDLKTRRLLRGLCWETMFGQEIAKLTMMDLAITILSTMAIDFFRALFVRFMNGCWCWDLEKKFPQYGDFKIAENILHLVNNQGMVWMGSFFSPGLIVLNVIKLVLLMYLRSWTVLTCNVPHEIVFKASKSNNFYLALLLTMLFLCVLPVGYAIVWVEPSWHCGPFSGHERIYYLATNSLKDALPKQVIEYKVLEYIASPGIVIPLIVLMTLIIYYMVSLTNSLRESNNDLKVQLRQERTEERRKMFKIAERRLENDTPFARWKKILPPTKSVDAPANKDDELVAEDKVQKHRSAGSDNSDVTEGEQESLPNDQVPTTSKNVENEVIAIINNDRKNSWRATRKEKSQSPVESVEGVATGAIPKIQISLEEANGEENVEVDLEEVIRRLNANSDEQL